MEKDIVSTDRPNYDLVPKSKLNFKRAHLPFFFLKKQHWTEKYKHHLEMLQKNPWSNNLNMHQQGTEKKNYEKYQDFILSNRKA